MNFGKAGGECLHKDISIEHSFHFIRIVFGFTLPFRSLNMQRQINETLDVRFVDHIKQDILDHPYDTEYDIMYLNSSA